jgi:hypothetical protein
VQATGNTGTGKRLVSSVFGTDGHETRHLNLGELDLAAAKGSERLELYVSDRILSELSITSMPLYVVRTMSATLNVWAGAAILSDVWDRGRKKRN